MRLLWTAIAFASLPYAGRAQMPTDIPGLAYRFDLRQADEGSDKLGLDFDVAFERATPTKGSPQGNHYDLSLAARGFTTFEKADRDVNSMVGQAALQGRYYRSGLSRPLPAEQQRRFLELADRDAAGGGPGLTDEEEKEYKTLDDAVKTRRWFATYDLHYRVETTQHVTHTQSALGAGGSAELPLLGGLLDVIPSMTRSRDFKVRPARAYVGVDYVTPHGVEAPRADSVDDGWRSRAELAWSTLVLDRFILRAHWDVQYLFAAPQALENADREFNNFLQLWLELPVSKDAGVIVKYLSGRLPPNYESTSVASLGLSISFY
jgi:hypothetical protein